MKLNEHGCLDIMPTLSVKGDYILTDTTWKSFRKEKFAIVGVTDSRCDTCC